MSAPRGARDLSRTLADSQKTSFTPSLTCTLTESLPCALYVAVLHS